MSNLNCPQCGGFTTWPEHHKCYPQWEVCFGDNVEQAIDYGVTTVYAYEVTDAVEIAAEQDDCNSGEYSIVSAGESKAWARKLGDTDWIELTVYGESVPQYTAHEVQRKEQ